MHWYTVFININVTQRKQIYSDWSSLTSMRANSTFQIISVVYAFQRLLGPWLSSDLVHALNHQPVTMPQCPVLWASLSWSGVLNRIPLAITNGWAGAAIASPLSPLNPDTIRRYLSVSGPTEKDEYSPEYHSPVVRLNWKTQAAFERWYLLLIEKIGKGTKTGYKISYKC